jgi:hypothetical protein
MRVTQPRTKIIINHLCEKHSAEYCTQYGEPGYQDPEEGIIFCNWNNVPKWVGDYLEEAGYSCEWEDEWYIDYGYSKAYRTSPDSYGWEPQIMFSESSGEYMTPDDPISDWIQECSVQSPNDRMRALPSWISTDALSEEGFSKYNGIYETGWHLGQTDDPRKTTQEIFEKVSDALDVVFRIVETSQFYIVWEAWVRRDE